MTFHPLMWDSVSDKLILQASHGGKRFLRRLCKAATVAQWIDRKMILQCSRFRGLARESLCQLTASFLSTGVCRNRKSIKAQQTGHRFRFRLLYWLIRGAGICLTAFWCAELWTASGATYRNRGRNYIMRYIISKIRFCAAVSVPLCWHDSSPP